MNETVYANARLVLEDAVVEGHLVVRDGLIAEIGEGAAPRSAVDMGGDHVLPGFVELHTDHVEGHLYPRPRVIWNAFAAVTAYDAQIAASGITTVFDSLRVWPDKRAVGMDGDAPLLSATLRAAGEAGVLRAEHFVHLRCEVAADGVVEETEALIESAGVRLISLMDHTPGQRQFATVEQFRSYYKKKGGMSDAELDLVVADRMESHTHHARPNRARLVAMARASGIVLASHDDATEAHVAEAVADGVAIAEFPTTDRAADGSHRAGIRVLMGAPNIVRGGSHTGNVAAESLVRRGVLDILSSDYVPGSLLLAVFDLPARTGVITLPQAVAMVSANPAAAAGLADRGRLAPGLRADFVRVSDAGAGPAARAVWRQGERIA
ncbi:alpha-D-ribose 1-methylphosphonate 5-triphosphate diphosphatase [Ancylobacter dichloromethanicus]|uniref:Phosphonate metabolism protein PhnM n=1 Tax=Ancylobacter dichloromethanicus TaxID=518825 RepID=A0A9W6N019_9HYPH|nr:alpha-D-ribose 1-methylphosphonate 5-triphosphate diphosphatase [Ancylobacter dichloromethanicus]MBS7553494.1 alpha-D-ribose 1-methylphosphonate 5-triphosphate diphosphatase [Ancylobacter dichloromethanicus]GLK72552.1 phosphonate metabolism protein PhnM [Ancylobacter dichloromethanicus]